MPYEFFLALRYLRARRPRRLARVTALAAITGIAFGVAALVVALALSNGFRDEMRDKILRGTAHITLMRRSGEPIKDFRALIARVHSIKGVSDASPTTYDGALLSGANNSAYAVLRGVDSKSESATSEIRRNLTEGTIEPLLDDAAHEPTHQPATPPPSSDKQPSPPTKRSSTVSQEARDASSPALTSFNDAGEAQALPGVVIGAELAARTGLRLGDTCQIISADAALKPFGLAPRYSYARVAGIFRSGLYEYDATWIYASLAAVSNFAGEPETSASVISIEVEDIYAASEVAARVRASVGDAYTTIDWQEANRPLFAALALERRMGLFIIALIILIAALNITTTLVLLVVERRSDIAILSAMGARSRSIMSVFMIEGALIGTVGALLGVVLGLLACFVGERYKLVSLPADVYSLSSIPFHARARDVALAALVAFVLSLLATIYPAAAAARLRPAEALRDG